MRKTPPHRRMFGSGQVPDSFYGGETTATNRGRGQNDLDILSELSSISDFPKPKTRGGQKQNRTTTRKEGEVVANRQQHLGWDDEDDGWGRKEEEEDEKEKEEEEDDRKKDEEEGEEIEGSFGSGRRAREERKKAGGGGGGGEETNSRARGFMEKMMEKSRERSKSRNREQQQKSKREEKENEKAKVLRPEKYMPPKKDEIELFDENRMIHRGKHFDETLTDESLITILGDHQKGPITVIRSFDECILSESIRRNIELKKYREPTQIQRAMIPLILKTKKDIMGHAQTGSGKTASFLLPIIAQVQRAVAKQGGIVNGSQPYVLIMVPTKELAEQLYEDARAFATGTGVTVFHTFGHMPMGQSMRDKEAGCDIFIATCGRIQQFVEEEYIRLDQLQFLVMDEADKLLKIGDFLKCVKRVKTHPDINPKHRCLMFSATFEDGARALALKVLRDDFYFVHIGELNTATDLVVQEFVKVEKTKKIDTLLEFLLGHDQRELITLEEEDWSFWKTKKTLVFVERKRHSDLLAIALRQNNINAMSINSDRTLKQRLKAAEDFATGKILVLVATDVAARGLNFPGVDTVINVDLPEQDAHERYIHRIGRTGRLGNIGHAISYFDPNNPKDLENAKGYVKILESTLHEVPNFLREALAEQEGGLPPDPKEESEEEQEDNPRGSTW